MKIDHRKTAPPVSLPLDRSHWLGWTISGIWVAGLLTLAAWMVTNAVAVGGEAGLVVAALVALGAASVGGVHLWLGQFRGRLAWDGVAWTLVPSVTAMSESTVIRLRGAPSVLLDLQSHLCLYLSLESGGHRWVVAQQSSEPHCWLDFRRALYSRPPTGAGPADEHGPADSRDR